MPLIDIAILQTRVLQINELREIPLWERRMIMQKYDHIFYCTVLNVLSCIAVIYLHVNVVFWTFPKGTLWLSSNFIETFFYFAVPIFFMLSGVLLIDYRSKYSTTIFFKKRVKKTVIPFVIWSIIAIIHHFVRQPHDINYSIISLINIILSCKYISIYWFFISLFSVYISMPILSVIDRKIFKYAIVVGITCISILPLSFKLIGLNYPYGITDSLIMRDYILYLLIGYYLANNDVARYKNTIYFLGIIGWVIHFYGTNMLSISQLDTTFKGYLKFPAVLHSVAIFVFIKQINWSKIIIDNPWLKPTFDFFSQYTFGVYLVHIYFVQYIPEIFHFSSSSIIWRMIGPWIIFLCSTFVVHVLRKVPVIKRIVP